MLVRRALLTNVRRSILRTAFLAEVVFAIAVSSAFRRAAQGLLSLNLLSFYELMRELLKSPQEAALYRSYLDLSTWNLAK